MTARSIYLAAAALPLLPIAMSFAVGISTAAIVTLPLTRVEGPDHDRPREPSPGTTVAKASELFLDRVAAAARATAFEASRIWASSQRAALSGWRRASQDRERLAPRLAAL